MPPVCNTGVHPPLSGVPFAHASRFDWYRATVPARHELVIERCLEMAGDTARVDLGKGRFNYAHSTTISVSGDRVATVLHGGSNGHPNVEASGDRAPGLAKLIRAMGEHRVTRCDVALDVYGDTAFRDLEGLAMSIAKQHGIGMRKIGNPLDPTAGETVYLGSRSSTIYARIYEKGKADSALYGDVEPAMLHRWVRCELEVKPQKDMKAVAASMPPEAFWGVSAWSQQLASEAFQMAPETVPFHPRRTASDERAYATLVAQYGPLLRRRCEDRFNGDRMALLEEFASRIWGDEEGIQAA